MYLEHAYLGSLVIDILLILGICFCLFKKTVTRSPITYAALFSAFIAFICSIINAAVTGNIQRILSTRVAASILSIINISTAFVPGLIGFYRISKQKGSTFGTWISIVGFLWAFIIIVIRIAANVMIQKIDVSVSAGIYYIAVYGHCALAVFLALLLALNHQYLHGKAKVSLVAYTMLFIVFEIFFFILNFAIRSTLTFFIVSLIFNDFVKSVALMISALYGHLWTTNDTFEDKVEVRSNDTYSAK